MNDELQRELVRQELWVCLGVFERLEAGVRPSCIGYLTHCAKFVEDVDCFHENDGKNKE